MTLNEGASELRSSLERVPFDIAVSENINDTGLDGNIYF
jgi:hypothetical protein